jgi:hypothetical protein
VPDAIDVLRDPAWGGIAVPVAIFVPVLGCLARAIYVNRTSDLTRDELRLLRAFNEQAKGNPRAYLSVEFTAYRVGGRRVRRQVAAAKRPRLPAGLRHQAGYPGHRPVWITEQGMRRAEKVR